jgi:mannose-6-phosphate isomerase-like protein (cupin superfamily)
VFGAQKKYGALVSRDSSRAQQQIANRHRRVERSKEAGSTRSPGRGTNRSYRNRQTTGGGDERETKGYSTSIEKQTMKNAYFRRVLYTGKHLQLVLMCLKPGEEIGEETHETVDQFFRFEKGEGLVVIDGVKHRVEDGSGVIVPSGARHNVINTSKKSELRLCTIYSPPEHRDKTVRKTKAAAEAKPEEYDGKPTEG